MNRASATSRFVLPFATTSNDLPFGRGELDRRCSPAADPSELLTRLVRPESCADAVEPLQRCLHGFSSEPLLPLTSLDAAEDQPGACRFERLCALLVELH